MNYVRESGSSGLRGNCQNFGFGEDVQLSRVDRHCGNNQNEGVFYRQQNFPRVYFNNGGGGPLLGSGFRTRGNSNLSRQFDQGQRGGNAFSSMDNFYTQRFHGQQPTRFVQVRGDEVNSSGDGLRQNYIVMKPGQNRKFQNGKKYFNHNNKTRRVMRGRKNQNNNNSMRQEGMYQCDGSSWEEQKFWISSNDNERMDETRVKQEVSSHSSNTESESASGDHGLDSGEKHVEKKIKVEGDSSVSKHNLSYEDITENSDNDDVGLDLRQRLLRRKQEITAKLEPGEINSEDEKVESEQKQKTGGKKRYRKCSSSEDRKAKSPKLSSPVKPCKSRSPLLESPRSVSSGRSGSKCRFDGKGRLPEPEFWGKGLLPQKMRKADYYFHDDRCTRKGNESRFMSGENQMQKSSIDCAGAGTCNEDMSTKAFCCPEAEIAELKEENSRMKRTLRETRDKLLDTRSKEITRMQDEIDDLQVRLDDSEKREAELKASFKDREDELVSKRAEVAKLSLICDVEKREKAKLEQDLTRIYQDRLTIEIDKLRALFDIEVAKMQAFYLSQNFCYEDVSAMPYMKPLAREFVDNQFSTQPTVAGGDSQKDKVTSVNSELNSFSGHQKLSFSDGPIQFASNSVFQNFGAKYPSNNVMQFRDLYASSSVSVKGNDDHSHSGSSGTSSNPASNNVRRY